MLIPNKDVLDYSGLVHMINRYAGTLRTLGQVFTFDGTLTDINTREAVKVGTEHLREYVTRLDTLLRTTEPTENSVTTKGETTNVG